MKKVLANDIFLQQIEGCMILKKIEISVSIFIITHFSERNKYSILLWVVIGTYLVFCQILYIHSKNL